MDMLTAEVAANFTGPEDMLLAGRDLRVAVRVSMLFAVK
jgi:hypothetical protein